MIFVPCRGGISHNEAEFTSKEQCAAGAQVLLQAVLDYDRALAERFADLTAASHYLHNANAVSVALLAGLCSRASSRHNYGKVTNASSPWSDLSPSAVTMRSSSACARAGSVSVGELADIFGVSHETIRRDLKLLADQGHLEVVHGGAARRGMMEPSIEQRGEENADGKARSRAPPRAWWRTRARC